MSNKNLSQSITEAWKTAVETGQRLDENKQKREQEVSKIFDSARTDVIQHVLENDHGFYRPDVDPFFGAVDGGMLRRQRLTEQQAPMPIEGDGGGASGRESEEVRKEVEKRMAAAKKREEEEARRILDTEEAAAAKEKQDRLDAVYTGSLTADGGDRAGRGREGLIRARGGNAQDIDIARRGDAARAEAEGRQKFKIGGGRGGYYYGDARITDNQGRTQAEREAQRERQREEQAGRSRAGAEERLKGLDAARREKLEKGLGPDADLDTVTTAIARERGGQDRVSELQAAGYGEGDYDPSTGGLTDQGRKKRADRQLRAGKRRAGVRARAEARENIQRTKADARAARLADRREARKKERLSGSGTALAGDKPAGKVGSKIFKDPGTQSSGGRTAGGQTEIDGDTPIQAGGAPESPEDPSSISIGMRETGTDGKTYVWDGQVWELAQ